MTELTIKPYVNKNMSIYRLDVEASIDMDTKKRILQKTQRIIKHGK